MKQISKPKEKIDWNLNIRYGMLQACYWFVTASTMVYVVALLRDRGFTSAGIGEILAAKYLAAVVSQFVLSYIVDKLARKISLKMVIYFLSGLCAIVTFLFWQIHMGYIGTMICYALFGCTINGVYPYINAMATKYTKAGRKVYYSYARGAGSVMWGISSVIISWSVESFGIESVLVIQLIMVLLQLACAIMMDKVPPMVETEKKAGQVHSYGYLFRHYPGYTLFLIASVCMFIANNLLSTYMVDIVSRVGGGNPELGYVEMALAIFELPPAVLFVTLSKKLNVRIILFISIVSTFIQIVLTLFAGSVLMLIFAQVFQIFGVGMYWAASVYYVSQEIPEQDWVKGQALINICSLGMGGVVGSLLSGRIMECFGLTRTLQCSAGIVAIGIVIMFAGMRISMNAEKRKKQKQEE